MTVDPSRLPNCWEIKKCGREEGGANENTLGVCPAYPGNGHSCWIVAGTFCEGKVEGTFAKMHHICISCEVYQLYSTSFGTNREQFRSERPEEFANCMEFFKNRKPG